MIILYLNSVEDITKQIIWMAVVNLPTINTNCMLTLYMLYTLIIGIHWVAILCTIHFKMIVSLYFLLLLYWNVGELVVIFIFRNFNISLINDTKKNNLSLLYPLCGISYFTSNKKAFKNTLKNTYILYIYIINNTTIY